MTMTEPSQTVLDSLARDIRAGLPLKYAAVRAGLHPATVQRWFTLGGSDPNSPLADAFMALALAKADRLSELLDSLRNPCKFWQATAWLIERAFPSEFGRSLRMPDPRPELPPSSTRSPTFAELDPARTSIDDDDTDAAA